MRKKRWKILEHYIYLYYIKNNNIIKCIVLQTVLNNALEFFLFSILEMKTLELYLLHSKWALSYYTHCACMQRLHSLSLRKHNLSQWYFLLARKMKPLLHERKPNNSYIPILCSRLMYFKKPILLLLIKKN